jgi:hypothetical protein
MTEVHFIKNFFYKILLDYDGSVSHMKSFLVWTSSFAFF